MKQSHIVKMLFAMTNTILIAACSITNAPNSNETQRKEIAQESPDNRYVKALSKPSGLPLTFDEAIMLTSKYPEKFNSAAIALQARPKSKKEITNLWFEVSLSAEPTTVTSSIQFTALGNGLEYFRNVMPATASKTELDEAGIDLFGLGAIVYTNNRFKKLFPETDLQPNQINVQHGEIFNSSSPFMLMTKMTNSETAIICAPQEKIQAERLHPKLTGNAIRFNCNSLPNEGRVKYWYLEDTSRYFLEENWSEGELLAKFKIIDVIYDGDENSRIGSNLNR